MGKLTLVPGPIGNLEDITIRAIRILKESDIVLAEDTRTSSVLLKHYEISTKLLAFHQHNEHKQLPRIMEMLADGMQIALLSDAGTPGISDPGFLLVRECVKEEIEVECLPGPTALIPALVQSGLPCDRFYFEGFLPHKKGRQTRINFLASLESSIALYESPHRLVKTLGQLKEVFGPERQACVCRELTKIHEESNRATLQELEEYYSNKAPKGEIVIIVEGSSKEKKKEDKS